jgi:hypothetical protein
MTTVPMSLSGKCCWSSMLKLTFRLHQCLLSYYRPDHTAYGKVPYKTGSGRYRIQKEIGTRQPWRAYQGYRVTTCTTVSSGLQRDVVYLGWPIASSYMSPKEFRGLSQWVQLYTGARFGDLTSHLTYDCTLPCNSYYPLPVHWPCNRPVVSWTSFSVWSSLFFWKMTRISPICEEKVFHGPLS